MRVQLAGLQGGAENAGLENRSMESDDLRLKQPQTSSTIDVSELSQNCVGLLHEVVDVRVHLLTRAKCASSLPVLALPSCRAAILDSVPVVQRLWQQWTAAVPYAVAVVLSQWCCVSSISITD